MYGHLDNTDTSACPLGAHVNQVLLHFSHGYSVTSLKLHFYGNKQLILSTKVYIMAFQTSNVDDQTFLWVNTV